MSKDISLKDMYLKNKYTNPIFDEATYTQIRLPRPEELGNLLRLAKGPSRTMSDFAKECQTSASTFSRISNGIISRPLSFETLLQIWECRDPEARITFFDLAKANGYEIKSGMVEEKDAVDDMRSILLTSCLAAGMQVQLAFNPSNAPRCMLVQKKGAFTIIPGNEDFRYWYFDLLIKERLVPNFSQNEYGEKGVQLLADIVFHHAAELLLEDAWMTDTLDGIKVSFVLNDAEVMEILSERLAAARVNGWISLILIDPNTNTVISEQYLPRKDGKEKVSLFNQSKKETCEYVDKFFI